jgi:hypothetical protein
MSCHTLANPSEADQSLHPLMRSRQTQFIEPETSHLECEGRERQPDWDFSQGCAIGDG